MIFLCGIPSEHSLGLVIERLRQMGAPHVVFHQRQFADAALELEIADGTVRGTLSLNGTTHRVEDFAAIYSRLMEWRLLPEVEHERPGSPSRCQCENLHAAMMQWHELADGRVLNRRTEIGLGYSKPFQSQLIRRHGFSIPETIVTNDPDEVRAFCRQYGRVIYKSASYVRSVVDLVDERDVDRLEAIRACPVQFQQFVEGINLRVHTVGRRAFATSIEAPTVDYRYAYLAGEEETLEESWLCEGLTDRCLSLAGAFSLEFAGIDLKVTGNGEIYCLEVNPSPAFSYYELHTGQPIAQAVAEYLVTGS
jgi:glutathione synthase/RimK-type ligase-like ATP-grasp enzyme